MQLQAKIHPKRVTSRRKLPISCSYNFDIADKLTDHVSGKHEMVTVNVKNGEDEQSFQVHKNFICHYSPYFNAAFNGRFLEGTTQALDLDDTNPKVFSLFVTWLYTQQIKDGGEKLKRKDMADMWMLADKVLVPQLQNQVMKVLLSKDDLTGGFDRSAVERIYENTSEDSPLRLFTVGSLLQRFRESGPKVAPKYEIFPRELLVSALEVIRTQAIWGLPIQPPDEEIHYVSEGIEDVLVETEASAKTIVQHKPRVIGIGPIRILKNKETDATRIIHRKDVLGTVIIDTPVTCVTFVDINIVGENVCINILEGAQAGVWALQFVNSSLAQKFVEILNAQKTVEE